MSVVLLRQFANQTTTYAAELLWSTALPHGESVLILGSQMKFKVRRSFSSDWFRHTKIGKQIDRQILTHKPTDKPMTALLTDRNPDVSTQTCCKEDTYRDKMHSGCMRSLPAYDAQ